MVIKQHTSAGTLESSDIMVSVFPGGEGITIKLESTVDAQYHDSICDTINEILTENGVENAIVIANDHGALDCTIRARLITALMRTREIEE